MGREGEARVEAERDGIAGECLDPKPLPHFSGLRPFVAGYPVDQLLHHPDKRGRVIRS
jgi:hypothetical protein